MMNVALAVLYPGIGQQQSVAIFLLIGELAVLKRSILLDRPTLYQFVVSINTIDDVQVGV